MAVGERVEGEIGDRNVSLLKHQERLRETSYDCVVFLGEFWVKNQGMMGDRHHNRGLL
jgi:hypothetical protein